MELILYCLLVSNDYKPHSHSSRSHTFSFSKPAHNLQSVIDYHEDEKNVPRIDNEMEMENVYLKQSSIKNE